MNKFKQNAIATVNAQIQKLNRFSEQNYHHAERVMIELISNTMKEFDISITEIDYNSLGSELLKEKLRDGLPISKE